MNKKRGYLVVVWVIFFGGGFPLDDEISHWILMLLCTIKIVKSPVGFPLFSLCSSVAEMGPLSKRKQRGSFICVTYWG